MALICHSDADSLNFHLGQADNLWLSSKILEAETGGFGQISLHLWYNKHRNHKSEHRATWCTVTKRSSTISFHETRTYLFSSAFFFPGGKKPVIKSSRENSSELQHHFIEDTDAWIFD